MIRWRERIQLARNRGFFTQYDRDLAGCIGSPWNYHHCAVGEQADCYGSELFFLFPLRIGVKDDLLKSLGAKFAGCVAVNKFEEAEWILDEVEDRALQIKRAAFEESAKTADESPRVVSTD